MTSTTNGLTQSENSKNKLKQLADARLNNKVADLSISCDNSLLYTVGASAANLSTTIPPLIYVTNNNTTLTPVFTGCTEENVVDENTSFATFFNDTKVLYIPKKAQRNLEKYVSKILLREIDSDETIAIEKCLIFLNNLSSLFFDSEKEYKSLNAEILHEQLKGENDNTYVYTKVIKALLVGTKQDGPMIEILSDDNDRHIYGKGITSKKYKLTETYMKVGITKYEIKTKYLIERRRQNFFKQLDEANENVIAKNLLKLYRGIGLPTNEEVLEEGKRLSKLKTKTKKKKIITYRNKRSNDKFKDIQKHSFVEDNIELYDYLTSNGLMVPVIGKEKSGGRVVDSFNLMPSWIRSMVTIDNEEIVEVDVRALHPNLAIKIFQGNERYLTHKKVSEKASIELDDVKVEHLSFFNKEVWQMKQSPLWNYYQTSEPTMMANIVEDKYKNGYKSTSKQLFKLEVEIMTEVISRLNKNGIYIGYVYDALFCKKSDVEVVKEMMDAVLIEFDVYTTSAYDGMNEIVKVISEPIKEKIIAVSAHIEMRKEDSLVELLLERLNEYQFKERVDHKLMTQAITSGSINTNELFEERIKLLNQRLK